MPTPMSRKGESQEEVRDFKVSDLVLAGGILQFAAGDGDEQHTPVELVVRTSSAVKTWLGNMIHDLGGMFHKEKVPLDWVHGNNPDEILGFLDRFVVSNKEIRCFGQIISIDPSDIAFRVVRQMKAGIPFESSIYFGGQGLVMEEIGENTNVEVNGSKFEGPGTVIRKWPLRGVAICPHGADNQTSISLALSEEKVPVLVISHKENEMAEEQLTAEELKAKEAKVKETEAKEAEAEVAKLKAKEIEKTELAKQNDLGKTELISSDGKSGLDFIKAFGDSGAVWFAEGKSYAEAATLYTQKLEERVKVLEERLKAAAIGGDDPVDFQDADTKDAAIDKRVAELAPKLGPALAKFAAGLKLRK